MMSLEQRSAAAAHWPRQQYENLFVSPSGPQVSERLAWVVEAESEIASRTESDAPELLAFLVARRVDAAWELENIVVAATARRRGIGARLLGELVEQARGAQGGEIFLEVRESNHRARGLYRKLAFKETGLRRNYYSNPSEDAILCRLTLN
jgi:ribosomal-protein-alanine acetyltransferase